MHVFIFFICLIYISNNNKNIAKLTFITDKFFIF